MASKNLTQIKRTDGLGLEKPCGALAHNVRRKVLDAGRFRTKRVLNFEETEHGLELLG
jgi:hypothetical protein